MASGIDKGSFGGIALAIGGILLGLTLEGGRIAQLLQPTAALIVFGGTLGAVLLQFPLATVLTAFASLRKVFFEHTDDPVAAVTEMVGYAQKARKEGIVSLEGMNPRMLETKLLSFIEESHKKTRGTEKVMA
jgi:chemotaxis protein MotA